MATIAITFCQSNGSSSKESFQMKVKKLGKQKNNILNVSYKYDKQWNSKMEVWTKNGIRNIK